MKTNNSFLSVKNSVKMYNRLCAKISVAIMKKRVEMNKTQKEFSKHMNVSQGMVSKWESGDYNFTVEALSKIFDSLDMDVDIRLTRRNTDNVIPYNNVKLRADSIRKSASEISFKESLSKAG